ncbi:MAG: RHS repeat-associated core domain-containing protein [Candidatus Firestonebacteria bacterium]
MGNVDVLSATMRYEYDACGKVRSETPSGDTRNKNKFVGGYGIVADEEDGLTYMRARYYDSETGRFISRDPIAGEMKEPLTLNKYLYCQNNPINYIDPDGKCRKKTQEAIDNMRKVGLNKMADDLQNKLDNGQVHETSGESYIDSETGDIYVNDKSLDNPISAADALAHEYYHGEETSNGGGAVSNWWYGVGGETKANNYGNNVGQAIYNLLTPPDRRGK